MRLQAESDAFLSENSENPTEDKKKSSTKSLQTTVHVRIQDAVGGDRAQ